MPIKREIPREKGSGNGGLKRRKGGSGGVMQKLSTTKLNDILLKETRRRNIEIDPEKQGAGYLLAALGRTQTQAAYEIFNHFVKSGIGEDLAWQNTRRILIEEFQPHKKELLERAAQNPRRLRDKK